MDKRKKPVPNEVSRAQRKQFYDEVAAGTISLRDAVKKMRSISGLTQPEFAKHRGVSVRVIRELEAGAGNPTLKSLNQIAEIFALEVTFRPKPASRERA